MLQPHGLSLFDGSALLDPMVPLCFCICLFWPLCTALLAASAANRAVFEQKERMRRGADAALAALSTNEADDVQFVHLRIKACDVLRSSTICWPGGRELGIL